MKSIFRFKTVLMVFLGMLGSLSVPAQNTMYGTDALASNTSGTNDSAFGYFALFSNTTGTGNTAAGSIALQYNTTGSGNTAAGYGALSDNTTGASNTAIGSGALNFNTTGSYNTAAGASALVSNTTGNYNSAVGVGALDDNSTGSYITADGYQALVKETAGGSNTAVGYQAGYSVTTGSQNIAIGYESGYNNPAASSYNIDIGSKGSSGDSDTIRIGTVGNQTSAYIAGISGVQINSGIPVYINSSGQLGTVNSSIRFKEDVHDMAHASDKLFQLRPVTYRYKQAYADGSKPVDYGLIAEEVAQVYPDLVARDASGEILTVQYQKLTPMLLNEVQKHHHQLESQEKSIQILEQRISALEAAGPSAHEKASVTAE